MSTRRNEHEQDGLMREIERYLVAVDVFRALHCEPRWKVERESPARTVSQAFEALARPTA